MKTLHALSLCALAGAATLATLPATAVMAEAFKPMAGGIVQVDKAWLDTTVPGDERAVFDSTQGFAAPSLETLSFVGEAVDLDQYEGKVVVLQSWHVKTPRGRNILKSTAAQLKAFGDDVQMIAIHIPDEADNAQAYLERRDVGMPAAIDKDGAFCDEVGIWRSPATIVIDKSGTIRVAGADASQLKKIVASLVKEDAPKKGPALAPRDTRRIAMPGLGVSSSGEVESGPAEFPSIDGKLSDATDFRGKSAPALHVESWITDQPNTTGKVVMYDFWATWCGPCIRSMPELNEWSKKFKDDLVIIGISDEPNGTVQNFMRSGRIKYSVAIDTQKVMGKEIKNRGIPHCLVVSPDGIVRWQGNPLALSEGTMEQIIKASGLGKPKDDGAAAVKRWVK